MAMSVGIVKSVYELQVYNNWERSPSLVESNNRFKLSTINCLRKYFALTNQNPTTFQRWGVGFFSDVPGLPGTSAYGSTGG